MQISTFVRAHVSAQPVTPAGVDASTSRVIVTPPAEHAPSRIAPTPDRTDTTPVHIAVEVSGGARKVRSIHLSGLIARHTIETLLEVADDHETAYAVSAAGCRKLSEMIASCSDLEIVVAGGKHDGTCGVPDMPPSDGTKHASLPRWRLKRVVEFIENHLDESISLADMAAAAGLSPMHFARQFRRSVHMRPHDYLLRARIRRSQQLLLATDRTLVDIALSVGFQGQAHFTTVFKRFAGGTPSQWRRENRTSAANARTLRQHAA